MLCIHNEILIRHDKECTSNNSRKKIVRTSGHHAKRNKPYTNKYSHLYAEAKKQGGWLNTEH